jgi:hypothetical protein
LLADELGLAVGAAVVEVATGALVGAVVVGVFAVGVVEVGFGVGLLTGLVVGCVPGVVVVLWELLEVRDVPFFDVVRVVVVRVVVVEPLLDRVLRTVVTLCELG